MRANSGPSVGLIGPCTAVGTSGVGMVAELLAIAGGRVTNVYLNEIYQNIRSITTTFAHSITTTFAHSITTTFAHFQYCKIEK